MADPDTANLEGASEEFNKFLKDAKTMRDDLLGGLETAASSLASTLGSGFTTLTGGLRDMMPAIPDLPDINLQAGLKSLSGLVTGSDRHTTLLNDITSNFGSALSSAGFSLSTLVTDAAGAIGKTLSGIVPRLQADADGLNVSEIASAIKQATSNSVADLTSTFTGNDLLKAHKEEIAEAQIAVIQALVPASEDVEGD